MTEIVQFRKELQGSLLVGSQGVKVQVILVLSRGGKEKKVKFYQIKLDGPLPMFIKSLYCRLFKQTTKTKQLTIESSPKLIQT